MIKGISPLPQRMKAFVLALLLPGLHGCSTQPPAAFSEAGKWGLKDASGSVIVPPTYELQPTFSDGLGRVRIDGAWGFVDHRGQVVIPAIYDKADPYKMGLIGVCLGEYRERKCGYIDKTGRTVIPFEYSSVDMFREESDGLAQVAKGLKHGLIRRDGSEAIPVRYERHITVQDGYAIVRLNGRSGVLSTSGKEVLPPIYDVVAYNVWNGELLNEGLFTVASGGKWGFVNTKGEVVIPFQYDRRAFFRRGQAVVSRDNRFFRIDKSGKETPIAPPEAFGTGP